MTKAELAQKIYATAHLKGEFKLRSGKISHEYFDKYKFESDPFLLREIALQMVPLIPPDTQVLAGLEMGGIPIATALALQTGLPVCFVRKQAKDYGTCLFAEGAAVAGKKVCIIEDVITSGGQVILSAADLKSVHAEINSVICVINRGGDEALLKLKEANLNLQSLFARQDFPN